MTAMNAHGEFVDGGGERRVRVRTDAEKREEALRRLVDAGLVGICDVCGAPFRREGTRKHAKRCSWECKQEANRRRARERAARERGADAETHAG